MSKGLLAKNLSALSTSAPTPSTGADPSVSRRGTCDRAFAADAEELIFLYGFSMDVSPFDRPGVPEAISSTKVGAAQARSIIAQSANVVAEKKAVPRTRDSVGRASDFVQISITLIHPKLAHNRVLSTNLRARSRPGLRDVCGLVDARCKFASEQFLSGVHNTFKSSRV
jgi:hypothetical protein